MTEKNKYAVAYLSWWSAWRMRCCPPDDLLYSAETRELTEHLQFCPWCRGERATEGSKPQFPVLKREKNDKNNVLPEPGQLWSLQQRLGGWGPKSRYYSPPLVVIIEVLASSVTVCQSYGDMDLAGSDDLPFQTDLIGFSQPWNRYSLRIDDLDTCYGLVFHSLEKELYSLENFNEQSFETGSLLWFFRQMEVETGYFFASQAIPSLMSEYEKIHADTSVDILALSGNDLQKMTSRLLDLGLVFPDSPSSLSSAIDLFMGVRASDDLLPFAAADGETSSDYALSFTIKNKKIISVEMAGVQITAWRHDGPLLFISGNLTQTVTGHVHVFFRLQTKKICFDPIPGEYGIEGDFFWALFQVEDLDTEEGECIVRIITDGK